MNFCSLCKFKQFSFLAKSINFTNARPNELSAGSSIISRDDIVSLKNLFNSRFKSSSVTYAGTFDIRTPN